jgi:hypothetical protein
MVIIDSAEETEEHIAQVFGCLGERFTMGIHVVRVQLDKPQTPPRKALDLMKDIGPVLTGIGTLLLSAVSFYYVHTMDEQKQALDREKTATEETNLRLKALEAFDNEDPSKQEIAAITLAAYGKNSLPSLRLLLGGSVDPAISTKMQSFGRLAATRWMDAGDADARMQLLAELSDFARADKNDHLRFGAYQALTGISTSLSNFEENVVANLLVERFGAGDRPIETSSEVADAASPLLNGCAYSRCRVALRNVAVTFESDQALESYGTILASSPESCPALLSDLEYVRQKSSQPGYGEKVDRLRDKLRKECNK